MFQIHLVEWRIDRKRVIVPADEGGPVAAAISLMPFDYFLIKLVHEPGFTKTGIGQENCQLGLYLLNPLKVGNLFPPFYEKTQFTALYINISPPIGFMFEFCL
ncbi:MAG: hypothetical protein FE835_18430 [Gammaproteobacteria bacterium]|nr:hypothetical protein [Gammaproteobacteria bacterium]